RLVGRTDLIVRGSAAGFDEAWYARLAKDPAVAVASPALELRTAVAGEREPLRILGLDPFRARLLQPALVAALGPDLTALWQPDAIALSAAAAARLRLRAGGVLNVVVGDTPHRLRVVALLPESAYPQPLGIMDLASAQWIFGRIGLLNRIDLRLADGVSPEDYRARLQSELTAGMFALPPRIQLDRTARATRAYRVNLDMLALVALWSGAFLVFSTQSLAVLRRRHSLALLRALGVTRGELELALAGEGALLGAIGSALGIVGGVALAAALLRALSGDLGNGMLRTEGASLALSPVRLGAYFAIGVAVATFGAWLPARQAAGRAPAAALKGGDAEVGAARGRGLRLGVGLCLLGTALARLPPVRGLPLFGYAAIALLLIGALLVVPSATARLLAILPRSGRPLIDSALAQLRDNVRLSTLGLASIIVSFSLMVAMAIMVHSFRASFERWLGRMLPADVEVRVPPGDDTALWSPERQARLASLPGLDRIEFRRTLRLRYERDQPSVTLIARDLDRAQARTVLPLVRAQTDGRRSALPPAWISEAFADREHADPGSILTLPIAGRDQRFEVAGIWRDYARSTGTVVVPRSAYVAASGDRGATEASLWTAPGESAAALARAVRGCFAAADAVQILTSTEVRHRSLAAFDRAFAITYALEAAAVLIGLAGVGLAVGATALARRAEFGVLRHLGLRRRDVAALLATEGVVLSVLGVLYGLLLGLGLSLILVYVVNRQSFGWSIDLSIPATTLLSLGGMLIACAALTALWSGRGAAGPQALRAVREDW
ncbi:MAG: FtsX-like permease family protein, partial [Gammaproteobacteria bacterium]|nr:FtsX-like permease family protein [Gammaproteobacteria bacterium]